MTNKMTKNLDKLRLEEYNRFFTILEDIQEFAKKHQSVSYIEFDYYVVHEMVLFSIEPDFDFEELEKTIHQIRKSLPAIKRIFNKPIIFLRDTEDILPVENTRIINQNTFLHLASHSHYVSNITKRGIKPRKLLTRIYEDEYGIYENIIFCNFIDEILLMIRKNRRILNSIFYASNIMKVNLLEKGNHVNYFLALGKLHTGYIRDFNQYFNVSKEMLDELSFINKVIKSRLYKPVYKKNSKRNKKIALKKTNIFLQQKDYRQVYKTYKVLLGNQAKNKEQKAPLDFDLMKKEYLTYVRLLTIFAVGHFNFETDPNFKMNLSSLDVTFSFKKWELKIINNDEQEIFLEFKKDKNYKIMITSNGYDDEAIINYKDQYNLDEVVIVNQFEEDYLERKDVYLSIQDIDSFRRIQQIVLRGMIYADTSRDTCPFCGEKLHKNRHHNYYQCNDCMIQIKEGKCEETNKTFFYTDDLQLKKHSISKTDFPDDDYWNYEKQRESLMLFRNITKINNYSDIICPHCNKVHDY